MQRRAVATQRALAILPLTPERLPDLAELFAQDSASRWCWCAYFRTLSTAFSKGTVASHRETLERAVDAMSSGGRAPGLVAYRDGVPIGWVSVGLRADYPRLARSRALAPVDDLPAWSIVCFVVCPAQRGRGAATALLDAAVRYAGRQGATVIEAYPVETRDMRVADGDAYKGTLRMFERVGFEVVARRRPSRTAAERPILRKRLRARQRGSRGNSAV